jgi:mismatch-specific thymine-DNA glycosylase
MLARALSIQVFFMFCESTNGNGHAPSGRLAMVQLGVSFQRGLNLVSRLGGCGKNLAGFAGSVKARIPGVRESIRIKMRTLPDYLRNGMKLIIVGCNPGDRSARVGHYYAGRGNEFWPLLYDSRVVPELLDHRDDKRMIEFGIGLTDLVKRPTRGIEELTREEFAEGRILLAQKLEQYAPQVIAFNGVGTFENFAQRRCKPGLQKERLYGAQVFVLPSTSAKNATGRAPKLRYFRQLAKVLQKLQA